MKEKDILFQFSMPPFCSQLLIFESCVVIQGQFRAQEDKKHRSKYQALGDSEKKLQFYAARQIACRLLGSRGYLCQKV